MKKSKAKTHKTYDNNCFTMCKIKSQMINSIIVHCISTVLYLNVLKYDVQLKT